MYIIEIFNIRTEESFKMFSTSIDIDTNRELLKNNLNSKSKSNYSDEDIKRIFLFKNSTHLPNTKFA
jgi:hypothetical protein